MSNIVLLKSKYLKMADKLDLIWFIFIPLLNINYILAGRIHESGFDISLKIDTLLPLIPIFIIPYIFWYVYVPLGLIYMNIKKSREHYMKAFLVIFAGMCLSYLVYYFIPTEYPRTIYNNDGFLYKLIHIIYSNDRPFNCFPSLHVFVTYVIMRYTPLNKNTKFYIYTQITGVLIILSTVFVKQHFILDAFGSIILFEILNYFTKYLSSDLLNTTLSYPRKLISVIFKKEIESEHIEIK